MREKHTIATIKDCEVQTFRVSGAGGQHRDKTSAGVRVVHPPSGAIGRCTDSRSQYENKRKAFVRMAHSPEFKRWVTKEYGQHLATVEQSTERIRTYHFIRNLVIDHRTGKTANLQVVLDGDLDAIR